MRRRFGALPTATVVVMAFLGGISCDSDSSSKGKSELGGDSGNTSGSSGRGGAGSSTSGSGGAAGIAGVGGTNSGGTSAGGGDTSPSGAGGEDDVEGGAGGGSCTGEVVVATQAPLDIYVMLDSSTSMVDLAGMDSKWFAVTNAMALFLNDPQSRGVGVGLQFFPLRDQGAPATCESHAACGSFGPCFQSICENARPDFVACAGDEDCVTDEGDTGPCIPLHYCWTAHNQPLPELILCHDDSECSDAENDCVPFAHCALNTQYTCKEPGTDCGVMDDEELGSCEAFAILSSCVKEASCNPEDYAAPSVEIAVLPGAAADLGEALTSHEPHGRTPMAPALDGALAYATDWARAHPERSVIVLLAADGLSNECIEDPDADPDGIEEVQAIASAGVAQTPSITTYVVAILGPEEADDLGGMNDIARAGGSDVAFPVDATGAVDQEFLAALESIRDRAPTCEFQIPQPDSGAALDFGELNVEFTSGGSTETLEYHPGPSGCDPATGGWYYDVPPSEGTPSKLIACPASCQSIRAASDGSVSLRVGCPTLAR